MYEASLQTGLSGCAALHLFSGLSGVLDLADWCLCVSSTFFHIKDTNTMKKMRQMDNVELERVLTTHQLLLTAKMADDQSDRTRLHHSCQHKPAARSNQNHNVCQTWFCV